MTTGLLVFCVCDILVWCVAFGAAEGTLFVRATLDANRCVHLMSVAHILSGECLWGYQNLFSHEQKAYPPSTIEGAQRGHDR